MDFRRNPPPAQTTIIEGQDMEAVVSYKYLGSVIDNGLTFDCNTGEVNNDSSVCGNFSCRQVPNDSLSFICWYGSLSIKAKCTG